MHSSRSFYNLYVLTKFSIIERLTESIKLHKMYPEARVIFSGGSGSLKYLNLTHADVAKKFFAQQQVNISDIIFESESKNTYENILYSKKIANPTSIQKWVLVTTAFHMNRALNVAEKLDWEFLPYAVDFRNPKKFSWELTFYFYRNFSAMQIGGHEWTGLIAYYLMGRTNKIY